jgi:hypothetical protein
MADSWSGFVLVLIVVLFGGLALALSRTWRPVAVVLSLGLALRVAGSIVRYEVLFDFYHGLGDAVRYFQTGNQIALRLMQLDLSVLAPVYGERLWGTPFVERVSGVVLLLLGPSMRGEFLVFSLLAFVGLLLLIRAFATEGDERSTRRYMVWLCLWPSLWFWPSSIGKEALLTLATGLVIYGYAGPRGRGRIVWLLSGLSLTLLVRPHLAAIFAVSLAASYWFAIGRRWTGWTLMQATLSALLALVVFTQALTQLGLGEADLEGVEEFVQYRSALTAVGGSSIETASSQGLLAVPMAFVNILMRPFPWEAHNLFALISALEITFFWILVWRQRRPVWFALRHWRSSPLLRFALPAIILYVLMLGLTFGNLGIISRQRTLLFPFLFLVLEAGRGPGTVTRESPEARHGSGGRRDRSWEATS